MLPNLVFKNPIFLLLLLLVPVLLWLTQKRRVTSLHFPSTGYLQGMPVTWKVRLEPFLPWLRGLALIFLIIALARPQLGVQRQRVTEKGIDIVLATDISTSMLAEDFTIKGQRYNRLDVLKKVLEDFIPRRGSDRLGMIAFAGRPYTVAPLTWDQTWLIQRVVELKIGLVEDGTAIGSAIMAGVNRLKESNAKSKVLILLTDGNNNINTVQPEVAADVAKTLGVKIYTIGAGSKGPVPYPTQDVFGRTVYQTIQTDIDETLMKNIATKTGGRYYRATDTEELYKIYREIDQLEKTAIEMNEFYRYREIFPEFILLALLLLSLEVTLQHTVMRRLP